MSDEIRVPAYIIRAAALFVDKSGVNTPIANVSVMLGEDGYEVAATNRYTLFCHTSEGFDPYAHNEQFLIPRDVAKQVKASDEYVCIKRGAKDEEEVGARIWIHDKHGSIRRYELPPESMYSQYPGYRKLWANETIVDGFTGCLDGTFLELVCKAAKAYTKKTPYITFHCFEGRTPSALVVKLRDVPGDVMMLVMPVKVY